MTVTIAMTAQTVNDAIVVPAGALLKNAEDVPYVLVAGSDGIAHAHTVEVGIRAADAVQILSGVSFGDAVITSGGYGLPDGTAIKTAVAKAPQASTEQD
jgi:multidrug efflux pump subunit AcrA (membrane-fusion protein)